MRVILVDTATMRSVAELPASSISAGDVVNGAGECDVDVSLANAPEIVPLARPWLVQVAITTDDYEPLWLGPVVKRRGKALAATYSLKAVQWESYLDRVWLPDDYDVGGSADATTVVERRILQAQEFVSSRFPGALPVAWPVNSPALCGQQIEYEFSSTYDGRDWWRSQPPSVLDDVRFVGERGFTFGYVPVVDAGVWGVELFVHALPTEPVAVLQVGFDIADIELSSDGERQVTDWWVVGESDVARATDTDGRPVLMDVRSYDSLPDRAPLQGIADALVASTGPDMVEADRVTLQGERRFTAGDVVTVAVPPGMYGSWPQGASWDMRVREVRWEQSEDSTRTVLSLEQQLDGVDPWALRPVTLERLINDLRARVLRTETRR